MLYCTVSFEIIPILVSIAAKTWNNHYSMRKGFRLEWRSDYIHEVFFLSCAVVNESDLCNLFSVEIYITGNTPYNKFKGRRRLE